MKTYQISVSYWYETPYSPRQLLSTDILCQESYEIQMNIAQIIAHGLVIPVGDTMQRAICPHQITDIVIYTVENENHAKAEVSDRAGDEILPVKAARSRKAAHLTAN